jgi:phosphodiesterase/alkaline phosphatase D-like protein
MADTDFEDVMAALCAGQRFQVGGGRIFRTYAMTNGQLVVIVSDDGYTEEHPCDEATLRAAIAEVPEGFRKIVDWWKAQRD